jgi:hypothetical protein
MHGNIRDSTDWELFQECDLENKFGVQYNILDRLYHIENFGKTEDQKARLANINNLYGLEPKPKFPDLEILEDYQYNLSEYATPGWDVASLFIHATSLLEVCIHRDIIRNDIYNSLKGIVRSHKCNKKFSNKKLKLYLLSHSLRNWYNLFKCTPGWTDTPAEKLWQKRIATLPMYDQPPLQIPRWAVDDIWKESFVKNMKLYKKLARHLYKNPQLLSQVRKEWKDLMDKHKKLLVDKSIDFLLWLNPNADEKDIPTFLTTPTTSQCETLYKSHFETLLEKNAYLDSSIINDEKKIAFSRLHNLSSQLLSNKMIRTSALIFQASRGYVAGQGTNKEEIKEEYAPCNALVFDDPEWLNNFITDNTWDESTMKYLYSDSILELVKKRAYEVGMPIMKIRPRF